jgi:hypothetical protein
LVEGVDADAGAGGVLVELACLDDDAQGQKVEVVWELELGTEILNREAWQSIGKRGFDDPRHFSAYLHTLRWNCVTATDPRLFQAPFRAGIRIDAYQLEPLRKALLLPRVNLFIADDTGLGKTIEAGLIATELLLRRRVKDVVVACPPSMIDQWKDELEIRFGLTFEVMDRAYIERVRQQRGYGVNPWTTFPRFLVSQRLLVDETYVGPMRDTAHFRDALSCSLELQGAKPLTAAGKSVDGIEKFTFPDLQGKHGGDSTWASTLDTLREPPKEGRRDFAWRRDAPIRPVVFDPPQGIDDDVVQIHLEHRVVQRLLGRFLAQGFVHHDLSRACFAQSTDAIPRVILIGRLSLYGKGASRLHEEIVTVTARWSDAASRKSKLAPYGRDAESKTLELLEDSLQPGASRRVPDQVVKRLQASIVQDIEELLPHLEARGTEDREGAETKLAERGRIESQGMRKILEEQRARVRNEFGKEIR